MMRDNRRIAATFLLIVATVIVLWFAADQCYSLEQKACFVRLTELTEQIGSEVKETFAEESVYLEQVAALLAGENLEDTQRIGVQLAALGNSGILSRMDLLLPGDRILTGDGDILDVSGILSFAQEVQAGSTISGRSKDILHPDKFVLRHCVPVEQDGEVTAVLCGVIDLAELPQLFSLKGYRDEAEFYIVEGKTGYFLQDTWHNSLSSVAELGERQTKAGYSWEAFLSSMAEGKSDSVVFLSQTTGEYFYAYMEPVGVKDWMVMVNMPENAVYAQAKDILHFYFISAILLLGVFTIYFMWMLWNIRQEKAHKEKQLRVVSYMLEVEKELFGAHVNPEHFITALQKVAHFMTAEVAFCWLVDGLPDVSCRLWSSKDGRYQEGLAECSALLPELFAMLQEKGAIFTYKIDTLMQQFPEGCEYFSKYGVQNLMLIPITGLNGGLNFILGVCNMTHQWENTEPLQQVALSFSVALNYYNAHEMLDKMGRVDSLTGLMNQNSYHVALEALAETIPDALVCVYMDVNGLHEMNNRLGHQAGDTMLIDVANALRDYFPQEELYRIGGDEFVALCRTAEQNEIETKAEKVQACLREKCYDLSIGVACWKKGDAVLDIVEDAEAAMQEDKRRFYQNGGRDRRARSLDKQLERMLVEKQDADTFLSVLAPEFKGVYFVKLATDTTRHLFIPTYFEEILQEVDDVFSKALLLYAKRFVKTEYYHSFEAFCDYEKLAYWLRSGVHAEFIYQKEDGAWLKLRVLKFKDYLQNNYETLWIFSNIDQPDEQES